MNRRAFLSLVATAPLVAAMKPWRPPAPGMWCLTWTQRDCNLPLSGTLLVDHTGRIIERWAGRPFVFLPEDETRDAHAVRRFVDVPPWP